ncbi:MAG: AbrB/MazE/SpoVT family DNA-binding domain-containing protein [Nitrospirae bacterium]|nr:AbrB/MazE/SpoVT family DNA-binding domain-containing protein [Nitrospirota bacterium]MBF0541954.1 AbrB/MazE/SpoVT family DNA-binding domain-containing protein [Nitrospirota bacterium]
MNSTVKITKKGQITLPKKIRQLLNSDTIEFEIIDDNLVLKPVQSVSGSLSSYAKKGLGFKSARDLAWEKAVNDKHK